MSKSPYEILLRPILTEKSMNLAAAGDDEQHQYTFQVHKASNKREIRWAVEAAYGVKVTNVSTITSKGKMHYPRARNTRPGKRADVKKAIVTLANGQQIDLV